MTTPDDPSTAFRFCPGGGGLLEVRAIRDAPRQVCRACGRVVYRHPAVGVAVVVRRGETLLFGRRARGPYRGAWCLPCGYVEWGEEVRAAAARECREETGKKVGAGVVLGRWAARATSSIPGQATWEWLRRLARPVKARPRASAPGDKSIGGGSGPTHKATSGLSGSASAKSSRRSSPSKAASSASPQPGSSCARQPNAAAA